MASLYRCGPTQRGQQKAIDSKFEVPKDVRGAKECFGLTARFGQKASRIQASTLIAAFSKRLVFQHRPRLSCCSLLARPGLAAVSAGGEYSHCLPRVSDMTTLPPCCMVPTQPKGLEASSCQAKHDARYATPTLLHEHCEGLRSARYSEGGCPKTVCLIGAPHLVPW